MINADELAEVANRQRNGYLKPWKAWSMAGELNLMPEIVDDEERLKKWVESCLKMEGFTQPGCDAIAIFIRNAILTNGPRP